MNNSTSTLESWQKTFTNNGSIEENIVNGSIKELKQTQLDLILRFVTFPTCTIAGLLGNALVIAIIIRRKNSKRSNIYETFLLNLAFTDCGVLLIQFVPGVIVGPFLEWYIGRFVCYVIIPLGDAFLPASSLTLFAISVVRYRGIMYPLKPKLSAKMSTLIIIVIWILSIIIAIAPFFGWLKAVDVPGKKSAKCLYTIPLIHRMVWFTSVAIMLFFVPVSAIWFIYFRLRQRLFEAVEDLSGVLNAGAGDSKRALENKKAIKMVFIVTILFTILYLPFFVSTSLHFFLDHTQRTLRVLNEIALLMICLNSMLNPIVYCIVNKSYRRELTVMFSCRRFYYQQQRKDKKRHSSGGPIALYSKSAALETKVSFSSNWV